MKKKLSVKVMFSLILSAVLFCMPIGAFVANGSNTMSAHAEESAEEVTEEVAEDTTEDFHARFSAKSKTYAYKIVNKPFLDVFLSKYSWFYPIKLDVEKMKKAFGNLGQSIKNLFSKKGLLGLIDQFKEKLTVKTDLYSLGVIFYEMMFKELPFSGENAEIINKKIDAILLNKYFSIPIFIFLLLLIYFLTFGPYTGGLLVQMLSKGFDQCLDVIKKALISNTNASI